MVINTNVEAQRTAGNLQTSQKSLSHSLARLSSGSKITNVSEDSAAVATTSRMDSRLNRINAVMTGLSGLISLTQAQDGYINSATDALTRMSELALLSQDETKSANDLALYQKEFNVLNEAVAATANKQFSDIDLFKTIANGATSSVVSIDENGSLLTILPVDLSGAVYTDAIKAPGSELSISNSADAKATLDKIKKLLEHLQQERTSIGATQSRVEFALSQLSTSKENLSQAKSRISDVNVAEETTRYARSQILVASGTQMLREANNLPQTALELLR
jgi:flagellin